jgi:hypothetical protein
VEILLTNPAPTGTLKATGVLFPPLSLLYVAAYAEVFKHDHLSFIRMEWLLLKAHLLYHTRSKKAIQDIWHHVKKHRLGILTFLRFLRDHFGG